MGRLAVYVTSCALVFAAPALAQENRLWLQRTFVTVEVPFQALTNDFSESLSFADTIRRSENVTFVASYESTRGALFDIGAGVRIVNRLGVGVTTSWFERSSSVSFDLRVPNPLAANRPLDLAGSVPDLNRNEVDVHVQALYAVPLATKARMMLAGGPSVFRTKQDLVRSIEFETLPGFTSLAFNQALTTRVERTVVGFNVSADVTWALGSHFGVGTVTRYSRANVTLDPGSESGITRAIDIHSGGLHVGGGIRLLF